MTELTTEARKRIPKGKFALPGGRYPVEDRVHAGNAKARAAQQLKAGNLAESEYDTVISKANAELRKTGGVPGKKRRMAFHHHLP